MLSAQEQKLKGILDVPDHLYSQYNRIRSLLEYCDLAQTYSVDAYDFLEALRSVPTVFIVQSGSHQYASSCFVRQTFEFKGFKYHADHSTLVTLSDSKSENLTVLTEGLGTTFSIEWENGEVEELGGHVGLNLYDCISKNTHQMLPSENQLHQLKTVLLFGICEQYNCTPNEVFEKLNAEFGVHAEALEAI